MDKASRPLESLWGLSPVYCDTSTMGLPERSMDCSTVLAATATARMEAADGVMPRFLRSSFLMSVLYLSTPNMRRVAPAPRVCSWMAILSEPWGISKGATEMELMAHLQSCSSNRPPMVNNPSSSIGFPVMLSEVSDRLYFIDCTITGAPSWLSCRSSVVMLHVSERSTSTINWPTDRSVSLLEPKWRALSIGHLPASIDSKNRVPPRSPRPISVRSSTMSDDLRALCR